MKKMTIALFLAAAVSASGQTDTSKWLRAFPITGYIMDLNDSVKLVQVELPEGLSFSNKQPGLVRGVYTSDHSDTVQKGYGRCHLIKGNYYYFTIGNNTSGSRLKAGDLLYTFMDRSGQYYGRVPKLASHFIRLQDIYENNFYDRYTVFENWTKEAEATLLDSMAADTRFTGKYFLENDSSMNQRITKGYYKDRPLLQVMQDCQPSDIQFFIDYIIARPRLYAGRQWKLSEIFATWLVAGAPGAILK